MGFTFAQPPAIQPFPGPRDFFDARAKEIIAGLKASPIPAAELSQDHQWAILYLSGALRYDYNPTSDLPGKFVSIRPVAIADDGKGGYLVGIAPE